MKLISCVGVDKKRDKKTPTKKRLCKQGGKKRKATWVIIGLLDEKINELQLIEWTNKPENKIRHQFELINQEKKEQCKK